MKRFVVASGLCLAAAFACPGTARAADPPSAEQVDSARRHHQAGTKLFNETDFAGALVEFQRAYETAPSYRVLYDIAQSYYQLQNYAAAMNTFERYLAEGGDQIPAARKETVQTELVELGKRVALVTVAVNVPGAEVVVDDQVVGTSPLSAPVRISAGKRKVKGRKTGMIADERTLDVAGGDKLDLALRLTPPQTVVQMRSESRPLLIGLGVTTGVLAVATGVFGALALVASDDWKKTRSASNVSADQQSAAIDKERAFAITTDVLGGLTIISGVATAIVFFKSRGDSKSEPAPSSAAAARPQVSVGPRSVRLSMDF
jgi:hypothetical protein